MWEKLFWICLTVVKCQLLAKKTRKPQLPMFCTEGKDLQPFHMSYRLEWWPLAWLVVWCSRSPNPNSVRQMWSHSNQSLYNWQHSEITLSFCAYYLTSPLEKYYHWGADQGVPNASVICVTRYIIPHNYCVVCFVL